MRRFLEESDAERLVSKVHRSCGDGLENVTPVIWQFAPQHRKLVTRIDFVHAPERRRVEARYHDPGLRRARLQMFVNGFHQLVERFVMRVLLDLDIGVQPQLTQCGQDLGQGRQGFALEARIEPRAGVDLLQVGCGEIAELAGR